MTTHEISLTPHLNFPYYVEREWFGVEWAARMTAQVWEVAGNTHVQRERRMAADGCLASLPLMVKAGRFVVRYYAGRELIRSVTVLIDVGPAGSKRATLTSTW